MKPRLFVCLWLLLLTALPACAQQNFFNVPSSDITPQRQVFFQQQFNLLADSVQSGTTLCYGIGHNAEIGVNLLGVGYGYHQGWLEAKTAPPYAPFMTVNLQKKFELKHDFALGLGTQVGSTRFGKKGGYAYADGIYHNEHSGTKLVTGLYTTNDSYFGPETRLVKQHGTLRNVGLQAGMEQNIWKDRLFFQADFISGKHALGEMVIGGAGYLNQHWVLSAGYQAPTFHSKSAHGVVIEITFVPKA